MLGSNDEAADAFSRAVKFNSNNLLAKMARVQLAREKGEDNPSVLSLKQQIDEQCPGWEEDNRYDWTKFKTQAAWTSDKGSFLREIVMPALATSVLLIALGSVGGAAGYRMIRNNVTSWWASDAKPIASTSKAIANE